MKKFLLLLLICTVQSAAINLYISPASPAQSSSIVISGEAISSAESIDTIVLSTLSHFQTISLGSTVVDVLAPLATVALDSAFAGGQNLTASAYLSAAFVANSASFTVANNLIALAASPNPATPGSNVVISGESASGTQQIDQLVLYEPISSFYQTVTASVVLGSGSFSPISTVSLSSSFAFGATVNVNAVVNSASVADNLLLPLVNQNVTVEASILVGGSVEIEASVASGTQVIDTLVLHSSVAAVWQTVALGSPVLVTNSLLPISTVALSGSFPSGALISINGFNDSALITSTPGSIAIPNTSILITQGAGTPVQAGQVILSALASGTAQEISYVVLYESVSNHYQTITPTNAIIATVTTLISTVTLDSAFPSGSTIVATAYNRGTALSSVLDITLADSTINISCTQLPTQGGVVVLSFIAVAGSQLVNTIHISESVTGHTQVFNLGATEIVTDSDPSLATVTLDSEFPSGSTLLVQGFN